MIHETRPRATAGFAPRAPSWRASTPWTRLSTPERRDSPRWRSEARRRGSAAVLDRLAAPPPPIRPRPRLRCSSPATSVLFSREFGPWLLTRAAPVRARALGHEEDHPAGKRSALGEGNCSQGSTVELPREHSASPRADPYPTSDLACALPRGQLPRSHPHGRTPRGPTHRKHRTRGRREPKSRRNSTELAATQHPHTTHQSVHNRLTTSVWHQRALETGASGTQRSPRPSRSVPVADLSTTDTDLGSPSSTPHPITEPSTSTNVDTHVTAESDHTSSSVPVADPAATRTELEHTPRLRAR